MGKKEYLAWRKKIDSLAGELLKKEILINQYDIWLENSEKETVYYGKDVYDRLIGVLQGMSNVDFIPGTGGVNFVAVVGKVQEDSGLDLGVCQFLEPNIDNFMKNMLGFSKYVRGDNTPECRAKEDLLIGSLGTCLPPHRISCPHRINMLEKIMG